MDMPQENKPNGSIMVTTGMYDLLKEQIRLRKLAPFNENKLAGELKNATQLLRKHIPDNVVDVDTRVLVLDLQTNERTQHRFVAHQRAKKKNSTESILSPLGIALIGYAEGTEVSLEMAGELKDYRIESVCRS